MRPLLLALIASIATAAYAANDVRLGVDTTSIAPLSAIGGDTWVYLSARNLGLPSDVAHDVAVVYVPPPGMTFLSANTSSNDKSTTATCTAAPGPSGNVTCTIPTLASATVFMALRLRLSPAVAAGTTLVHNATLSTPSDPSPANKSATFTTTAAVAPTISISTSYPKSAVAGAPFTYIITFRNSGTIPATNLVFDDSNDSAVVTSIVQSAGAAAPSCHLSYFQFDPLRCLYSLAPGESVAFAVTRKADPTYPGYPMTETVTAFLGDFGIAQSETRTAIATAFRDAAVTVASPAQAQPGVDFPVRITVSAAGPSMVPQTTLTIAIPEGTSFAKLQPFPELGWATSPAECTTLPAGGSGTITCKVGFLMPPFYEDGFSGARAAFDLHLVAAAAGSVTTRATVSAGGDVNAANDSAAAATIIGSDASADLALSMDYTGTRFTPAGTEIDFTRTVVNNGVSQAANVVITNAVPAGATPVSTTCPNGVCTTGAGTLGPGARFVSTITFRVPSTVATLVNQATVSAATPDPVPGNNSATATGTAVGLDAVIFLADVYGNPEPLPAAVPPSAPLLYLVMRDPRFGGALSVALPAGSVISSPAAGNGVTISGSTLTYSSAPSQFVIAATAPAAPGHYTATISAPGRDAPPLTMSFDVVAGAQPLPAAELAVLVQPPAVAPPLELATYVASVANRGPSPAPNVRLTFTLPPHTTLDHVESAAFACNAAASPIVCTAPSIANGETLDAAFVVRVGDVPFGDALPASATVHSDAVDPYSANDSAAGAAIVAWPTQLDVRVDPTDIAVAPGTQWTEVITVTNVGKGTVAVVQVGDNTKGLQVISQTAPGATCSGSTVICTAPTLAPGQQIVVTAVLKAPASGSVTHFGYAISYGPDLGLQNFVKTLNVVVTPRPWHRSAGH